jgi:hypothetical protein
MIIERQQDVTVAAASVMERTFDPRLREIMLSLVKGSPWYSLDHVYRMEAGEAVLPRPPIKQRVPAPCQNSRQNGLAARAFSSEVDTGSRQENASKKEIEPRSDSIGTERDLEQRLIDTKRGSHDGHQDHDPERT